MLVNRTLFPATVDGTAFELRTESLAPATYSITTDCAGAVSDPAPLTVTPSLAPQVVCARNASPRDGTAEALRSDLNVKEAQRIDNAKKLADAAKQKWPTPEETALLLGRCDEEWVWTLRLEDRLILDVAGYSDWILVEPNSQRPLRLFSMGLSSGRST